MELIRNKSNSIDVSNFHIHKVRIREFTRGLNTGRLRSLSERDQDEIEMECGSAMILPEYKDQWEFDDDHGHRYQLALRKIERTDSGCRVKAMIIGSEDSEEHGNVS